MVCKILSTMVNRNRPEDCLLSCLNTKNEGTVLVCCCRYNTVLYMDLLYSTEGTVLVCCCRYNTVLYTALLYWTLAGMLSLYKPFWSLKWY